MNPSPSRSRQIAGLVMALHKAHDAATFLWPDPAEYTRQVGPYRQVLEGAAKDKGISTLAAYNEVHKTLEAKHPEAMEGHHIRLTAALLDILEPKPAEQIAARSAEIKRLLRIE